MTTIAIEAPRTDVRARLVTDAVVSAYLNEIAPSPRRHAQSYAGAIRRSPARTALSPTPAPARRCAARGRR